MTIIRVPRHHRWPYRGLLASALIAVAALVLAPVASASPPSQGCPVATPPHFSQAAGASLGCATSEPFMTNVADQVFEHGRMVWVEEWASISVLYEGPDSRYDAYDDLFSPDQPQPMPLSMPDSPQIEPRQGFGRIWRQLGGPDSALGWGTSDEQSFPSSIQYFQRGVAIQRPDSTVYVLQTLNHTRGTWQLVVGGVQ